MDSKPVEVKEVENLGKTEPKEVDAEKTEEPPAVAAEESNEVVGGGGEESSESTPSAAADESTQSNPAPVENSSEAATEESSENAEDSGDQEVVEEAPEIKVGLPTSLSMAFLLFGHLDLHSIYIFICASFSLICYILMASLRQHQQIFVSLQQIKQGTALPVTLSIIGENTASSLVLPLLSAFFCLIS